MVEYLEGNYILWQIKGHFRTTFDGGDKTRDLESGHLLQPSVFPLINNINNMLQLPFGGKFVGIIAHIFVNQMNSSFTEGVTWEFIKTTGGGTTFVPTGLKVVIPGGETGFFYSNTDIAEFTRTWEPNEYISLRQTKQAGSSSFPGTGPASLTVLLDLEPT